MHSHLLLYSVKKINEHVVAFLISFEAVILWYLLTVCRFIRGAVRFVLETCPCMEENLCNKKIHNINKCLLRCSYIPQTHRFISKLVFYWVLPGCLSTVKRKFWLRPCILCLHISLKDNKKVINVSVYTWAALFILPAPIRNADLHTSNPV